MPEADPPPILYPPDTAPAPAANPLPDEPHAPDYPFAAQSTPTSAPSRLWLTLLTLALLAAIVYFQRPGPPDPAEAQEDKLAAVVKAPKSSPYILMGKLLLGLREVVPNMADLIRSQVDQSGFGDASSADELRMVMLLVGANATKPGPTAGMSIPGLTPPPPRTPEEVLDGLEKNIAPDSPLRADIAAMRPLVAEAQRPGADERSIREVVDELSPETRDGLKQRHGWFAEVLFTTGDKTAPVRAEAAAQGGLFGGLILMLGLGIMLAILIGLILLILGIVWKANGAIRWSFAPSQKWTPELAADPRRVWARGLWLETFAVFLAGFLGLKGVQELVHLAAPKAHGAIWVSLFGQWSLLACIFWPVARGLSWPEWREQIGWRAPAKVGATGSIAKEVGAGIAAYLAALPIYFFMAIIVVILMFITEAVKKAIGAPPGPPPGNKITEIIGGGGTAVIIVVFLLATVWAPIVEESIFRGALYRQLRGRYGLLGAGALSAAAFALMHGYLLIQLLMIFTLGMVFAVMREWRNSIIPSATAHFMHNTFAMTVMLIAAWFMRA